MKYNHHQSSRKKCPQEFMEKMNVLFVSLNESRLSCHVLMLFVKAVSMIGSSERKIALYVVNLYHKEHNNLLLDQC